MGQAILIVDTASETLRAGLFYQGELKVSRFKDADFSSDVLLFKAVRGLLGQKKIRLGDIGAIAVSKGPGRFTGIRVGMTFASILSSQLEIPALAISRLEAIAFGEDPGLVCPVLPGYRGEKYHQIFASRGSDKAPRAMSEPGWSSLEDWERNKNELTAKGARLVSREAEISDFLAAARFYLSRKKAPRFWPLYLKAASYERK